MLSSGTAYILAISASLFIIVASLFVIVFAIMCEKRWVKVVLLVLVLLIAFPSIYTRLTSPQRVYETTCPCAQEMKCTLFEL